MRDASIDYAALFHDSPSAHVVVDRRDVIVDVNDGYARLARRERGELVGRDFFDVFDSTPNAERLKETFQRVAATGRPEGPTLLRFAVPISLVEGDGVVDVLWNVTHYPLRDDTGRVACVAQVVEDLTALRETVRQAEMYEAGGPTSSLQRPSMHASESDRLRLLRLFDQALSFTVFMREPEHVVELANPAYLRMVGEEDLRGRRYTEAHRGDPPVPLRLLDAVYESGVPIVEHGLALRVPDGANGMKTIYVDVVIQQILDVAGNVLGVFMQGNDVTMAKATTDELSAYRARLEEMVAERTRALERSENERRSAEAALHRAQRLEAVGKLTGGVAHDFNNVLQIIRGNLQLLQRQAASDRSLSTRIEAALDGVDRGAKLASQLLAFGRRQPLEPIVVDLQQVLGRMEDLLRRSLGESIEVVTRVSPDLWHVMVDVPRLENVILNIALNARDAMDHSGRLVMELANTEVGDAEAKREDGGLVAGDYVTLTITDDGSGMTPEVQRRAFEPFFTTKPEGEGTGLGLSMVYGFMKQSGGHVVLQSEEGVGTTIRLYLPRTDEPVFAAAARPEAAPARGNGETILVVEDDEAVRLTVVETLIDLGYRVLRASDGQSALTILKSGVPVDLLFTDVVMPGPVASTELVRQARLLLPRMQVLFTSGFTRDAIVDRDRLKTGVNLLSKPYDRDELARRLRQLFDDHAAVDGAVDGATAPAPAAKATDGAKRRVLLVEDSEDVREATIEFINEVGFDVVAVESAEQALEALDAARYDVLFTDVSLPGISGIELLKRVRKRDPAQRIVIASGYGAEYGRYEFGPGVAVLAKPYDLATLEQTLDGVLSAPPANGDANADRRG